MKILELVFLFAVTLRLSLQAPAGPDSNFTENGNGSDNFTEHNNISNSSAEDGNLTANDSVAGNFTGRNDISNSSTKDGNLTASGNISNTLNKPNRTISKSLGKDRNVTKNGNVSGKLYKHENNSNISNSYVKDRNSTSKGIVGNYLKERNMTTSNSSIKDGNLTTSGNVTNNHDLREEEHNRIIKSFPGKFSNLTGKGSVGNNQKELNRLISECSGKNRNLTVDDIAAGNFTAVTNNSDFSCNETVKRHIELCSILPPGVDCLPMGPSKIWYFVCFADQEQCAPNHKRIDIKHDELSKGEEFVCTNQSKTGGVCIPKDESYTENREFQGKATRLHVLACRHVAKNYCHIRNPCRDPNRARIPLCLIDVYTPDLEKLGFIAFKLDCKICDHLRCCSWKVKHYYGRIKTTSILSTTPAFEEEV